MVDHGQHSDFGPVTFGKYLLDEEIARGGMARVYLARLRGLGGFEKRLVVKQILPHLAEDPRFVAMFVDEAKTLVALSHPHVVPVYELGVEGGVYFLAMEHVEGATLADMLTDGPLSDAEAAHVGVQIADALAYAEEKFGLVHRDVTPRNVMVEGSGHARLLDFGIAARADAGDVETEAKGEARGLYGTPGYLSPEQARGERLSAQSDLFALACVLFEVTQGRPLFSRDIDEARTLTKERVASILGEELEGEGELTPILRKCLQPDPADRPESARVLLRMLRAVAQTEEDPAGRLGQRADLARKRVAAAKKTGPSKVVRGTPTSGPDAPSATLATSELLGSLLDGTARLDRPVSEAEPSAMRERGDVRARSGPVSSETSAAAERSAPLERPKRESDSPRTARIVPATSREETTSGEGLPATSTALPAPRRSLGIYGVAVAIGLGAIAALLAGRGELDPRVPDASVIETDTDATMSIPPEDAGPDAAVDAGVAAAAASADADVDADADAAADLALEVDAAAGPDAGDVADAGEPLRRAMASLRVTSDGSLTVRVDGRPIGHAPIAAHAVSAGEHRLTFECDFLDRSAEERVRFVADGTVRIRVTCNTSPVRVVVVGP